jgi:hypothetical protein
MIYQADKGRTSYGEAIGIIMLESFIPFPPGSLGNASTFPFPVRYAEAKGATVKEVVLEPNPEMAKPFIAAANELVAQGVRAITGNCGYMVLYQDEIAREIPVPVFMSSLLQLPFISRMLCPGEKVGVLTANLETLSSEHLKVACNGLDIPFALAGMSSKPLFRGPIIDETGVLDFEGIEAEVVETARELVASDPSIKVLLFECTDLPPFAAAVQRVVGLPVFDCITMINHVFSSLVRKPYDGFM